MVVSYIELPFKLMRFCKPRRGLSFVENISIKASAVGTVLRLHTYGMLKFYHLFSYKAFTPNGVTLK